MKAIRSLFSSSNLTRALLLSTAFLKISWTLYCMSSFRIVRVSRSTSRHHCIYFLINVNIYKHFINKVFILMHCQNHSESQWSPRKLPTESSGIPSRHVNLHRALLYTRICSDFLPSLLPVSVRPSFEYWNFSWEFIRKNIHKGMQYNAAPQKLN